MHQIYPCLSQKKGHWGTGEEAILLEEAQVSDSLTISFPVSGLEERVGLGSQRGTG